MNIKIFVVIFLCILFSPFYLKGQKEIEGKVSDNENNTPIEYATVALFSMDSLYISGTSTDDSGYLIFNKTLNKFLCIAGMRWELTQQKGKQEVNNEKFDKNYNDWFPSASVQYNIKNDHSVMLSYTRKISRPEFSAMNPFMFYTSPQTYQIGNPNLDPSYNNSVSMRYAKNQASLTLLYNSVKNEAVLEAFQDDKTKEINNARNIKLSFTYKFGSDKIKKSQNRNTGIEDVQQRIN